MAAIRIPPAPCSFAFRWSGIFCALYGLLSACGSGDPKPSEQPPGFPELGLLSKRIIDGLCENQFQCPISYDKQLFRAAYFQERTGDALDNCRAYYAAADTEEYSRYKEAEARGTLQVDSTKLNALSECQLGIEDDSWLVGKVPVGDACRLHVECESGYCETSSGCPGTCVARKPDSAACSSSAECLSGVCDGTCAVGSVITTGLGEGAACSEDSPDERLCAQGLWCNPSAGKCQRPIAAGDVCQDDDDVCEPGHVCAPVGAMRAAEREWRCLRLDVQAVGEPCDSAGAATSDSFRVCDLLRVDVCVDGLCVHHPEGRAGDPCGRTDVGDTCASGLACQDSVCVTLLADGAECSGSGECLGRCNFETGRCETPALYCEEPP